MFRLRLSWLLCLNGLAGFPSGKVPYDHPRKRIALRCAAREAHFLLSR